MALTYKQNRNFWGKEVGGADPESVMWTPEAVNVGRESVDPAFRNQQLAFANQLQAQAAGTAPSIAQAQLQQATDANIAQQRAMAASGRGTNLGLAQKLAATNAMGAQQQLAGQSAITRLQEQNAAQQLLGNTLTAGRTGDINTGQLNVAQRGQDIQNQQTANQQNLNWAQTLRNYSNPNQGSAGSTMAGIGGIIGGLGAMFSDENLKKNIETEGEKKVSDFLENIQAHEYEYKEPEIDGYGKHFSPMAQEIEKSEVGKSMVDETPRGKIVNYGKGFGVMLAAQGYLNDRLNDIEKALKVKRGQKNG